MKKLKNIPLVILAGGYGTRIMELSHLIPKPMIEIGNMPILLHIMKYYASYGVRKFIICGGYKCEVIKNYFKNFNVKTNDIQIDLNKNKINFLTKKYDDWSIIISDTGENTQTGGRIKRIKKYIDTEYFFMTYGDGLSDVNVNKLFNFHLKNNKFATVTTVSPKSRFGLISYLNKNQINFREKPDTGENFINAGFFVLSKEIFNLIKGDNTNFEENTLDLISKKKELIGFKHSGFWQCMDNQRDKLKLESLWSGKKPPWKKW